jgi:hypothetical protein
MVVVAALPAASGYGMVPMTQIPDIEESAVSVFCMIFTAGYFYG